MNSFNEKPTPGSVACRKCGATPNDGVWLERVNEKGVLGIWECRPDCTTKLSPDERLIAAIEHASETAKSGSCK